MELYVLADDGDPHASSAVFGIPEHLLPFRHIRRRHIQPKLPADDGIQTLGLQHERGLVEDGHGAVLDDAVPLDVAEEGDFFFNLPV